MKEKGGQGGEEEGVGIKGRSGGGKRGEIDCREVVKCVARERCKSEKKGEGGGGGGGGRGGGRERGEKGEDAAPPDPLTARLFFSHPVLSSSSPFLYLTQSLYFD